jgi:hypothetical protein
MAAVAAQLLRVVAGETRQYLDLHLRIELSEVFR